jgi:hypothetical protein
VEAHISQDFRTVTVAQAHIFKPNQMPNPPGSPFSTGSVNAPLTVFAARLRGRQPSRASLANRTRARPVHDNRLSLLRNAL